MLKSMATSRFFYLSSSIFRTYKYYPVLSYKKSAFTRSRLHTIGISRGPVQKTLRFYSESSVASIVDASNNVHSSPPPWPEWTSFLEKLQKKGYFDENSGGGEEENGEVSSYDFNHVKTACLKFARERFDILRSMSRKDIQTVVECGCPNLFRKAVNSAKRLRAFVKLDEGEVCGACNLRGSCDRAYLLLEKDEGGARTVDIVRILLSYVEGPQSQNQEKNQPNRVENSIRNLLSELVQLSDSVLDPSLPKPAIPDLKKAPKEYTQDLHSNTSEMKRGDWICTKCNFMNFARNLRCLMCKEDGPKKINFSSNDIEMKKGDWICPKCSFMNFARNKDCFRCHETQPKRELNPGEWQCPSCNFVNFRRNVVCLKCNITRPKDTVSDYDEQMWKRPEARRLK